jgi:hypothetical protein
MEEKKPHMKVFLAQYGNIYEGMYGQWICSTREKVEARLVKIPEHPYGYKDIVEVEVDGEE